MAEPLRWFNDSAEHPPWIKALAEVRHKATREGWCYPHVQAIIVAIDQYAEAATGNRGLLRRAASHPWLTARGQEKGTYIFRPRYRR
jgi:hypothetical protein